MQITEATIEGRDQGTIGTYGGGYIGHAVGKRSATAQAPASRAQSAPSPVRSPGRRPRRSRRRSVPGKSWSSWKAARKRSRSCNPPIRTSAPARRFASTRARTARRASPSSSSLFEQLLQLHEGRLPGGPSRDRRRCASRACSPGRRSAPCRPPSRRSRSPAARRRSTQPRKYLFRVCDDASSSPVGNHCLRLAALARRRVERGKRRRDRLRRRHGEPGRRLVTHTQAARELVLDRHHLAPPARHAVLLVQQLARSADA